MTRTNFNECDTEVTLSASEEGQVRVCPLDLDEFLMTQREAVAVLKGHQDLIHHVQMFKESIENMFMDLARWAASNPVSAIYWGPGMDESLFAVVASNDSMDSELYHSVAALDLDLHKKYKFRLSFMVFRASEADGVACFIPPKVIRQIYPSANVARPSC